MNGLFLLMLFASAPCAQTRYDNSANAARALALENFWAKTEKMGEFKALNSLLEEKADLLPLRWRDHLWF